MESIEFKIEFVFVWEKIQGVRRNIILKKDIFENFSNCN